MSEQSQTVPTESQSVLLQQCHMIYDTMNERADNTPQGRVFTGSLVKLFDEVGLGQPYYTVVTRRLQDMDCIRQIQRGGGPKPSRWMLLQEPSEQLFQLPIGHRARMATSQGAKAMQAQQTRDLNTRLTRLEAWARNQGYRG